MKKFFILLSTIGLTLVLCACGKDNANATDTAKQEATELVEATEIVETGDTEETQAEETQTEETQTEETQTEEMQAEETSDTVIDIVGIWTEIEPSGESYSVLELNADGSGSLMTEPEDMGVALNYEIDGTTIMTHLGSADDNSPMEYLADEDQIKFGDVYFCRSK